MKRPAKLSATFVKTVTRPGRYGDGRGGFGLSLRVKRRTGKNATGVTKTWSQRLWICGKCAQLGLGSYPFVTLAEAREKALANRLAIAKGRDPRDKPQAVPTFADAFEKVITLHRPGWKHGGREERIWRSSFRMHVLPTLGRKPVNAITPGDVLSVLEPVWAEKQDLAHRLRQRMGLVFDWCVTKGYRVDNPAGRAIGKSLPKRRGSKQHYPALPYAEVGAAVRQVRESGCYLVTALCFEFLVLTAARSGEARLAHWNEIDTESAIWTIPAERMKMGRAHRVPLSKRALEVLDEAAQFRDRSGLVFPSVTGRVLSDATLSKRLKDLKINAVPHGFRASLRTWGDEQTDASRATLEACLAHKLGDSTESAYRRGNLYAKRAVLMQQWDDYIGLTDARQRRLDPSRYPYGDRM